MPHVSHNQVDNEILTECYSLKHNKSQKFHEIYIHLCLHIFVICYKLSESMLDISNVFTIASSFF